MVDVLKGQIRAVSLRPSCLKCTVRLAAQTCATKKALCIIQSLSNVQPAELESAAKNGGQKRANGETSSKEEPAATRTRTTA